MVDSKGYTTYKQILELENAKRIKREKLTLIQRPFETLCVFCLASYSYFVIFLKYIFLHPVLVYFLMPVVFIWLISEQFPGPYTGIINKIEFYIQFIIWWVGLGILSSIGFGSGLQTGMLFLFVSIVVFLSDVYLQFINTYIHFTLYYSPIFCVCH